MQRVRLHCWSHSIPWIWGSWVFQPAYCSCHSNSWRRSYWKVVKWTRLIQIYILWCYGKCWVIRLGQRVLCPVYAWKQRRFQSFQSRGLFCGFWFISFWPLRVWLYEWILIHSFTFIIWTCLMVRISWTRSRWLLTHIMKLMAELNSLTLSL